MSRNEKFNTQLAVNAELARRARDGGPADGVLSVKVGKQAISVAGQVHEPGSTFQASEPSVEQALARGLVEKVESKAKK